MCSSDLGALDVRATRITPRMKVAAAEAIAGVVGPQELSPTMIVPSPFNPRVAVEVAGLHSLAEALRHEAFLPLEASEAFCDDEGELGDPTRLMDHLHEVWMDPLEVLKTSFVEFHFVLLFSSNHSNSCGDIINTSAPSKKARIFW